MLSTATTQKEIAMPVTESVVPSYLRLTEPSGIPGLATFWHFNKSAGAFDSAAGNPCTLVSQTGELDVIDDPTAPLGGKALALREGQWLNVQRKLCPFLNFHGSNRPFTLLAWLRREKKRNRGCEFIAGMWNESQCGRQYGLFLDISVWQQHDQVCGHLSNVGGPTPGYQYCIDGPVGSTPVPFDSWSVVGMSYDGYSGYAWLNGSLDFRPGLNPYSMADGLHNGGENGSDFTVGAVDRSGQIGNFFAGRIAGIAIYHRALTPAEIYALSRL